MAGRQEPQFVPALIAAPTASTVTSRWSVIAASKVFIDLKRLSNLRRCMSTVIGFVDTALHQGLLKLKII